MYKTREDVENWLKQMKINNYIINEDLTVDVDDNVDISFRNLNNLPINFRKVKGYFYCYYNKLTSLKGCPEIIDKNFSCNKNELTNFNHFPKEIYGHILNISGNKIKEEELINFNCKMRNIEKIYSNFNKNGNKEEFLNKINYYKNIKKENELLNKVINKNVNSKLNKKL